MRFPLPYALSFLAMLLAMTPLAASATEYHFRAGENKPPLTLKDGATMTPEGWLHLDGQKAYAELQGTENLQIAGDTGFTVVVVARQTDGQAATLVGQDEVFQYTSAPDGNYAVSTHWAGNPAAGYLKGLAVRQGEGWDFSALVVTRLIDSADGTNGYRFALYASDGQCLNQRDYIALNIPSVKRPLCCGKGTGMFAGDLAAVHVFSRPLAADELQALAADCGLPLRKVKADEAAAALQGEFATLEAKASVPLAKWLVSCLKLYNGPDGTPQSLRQFLGKVAPLLSSGDEANLVATWNKKQSQLRLLASQDLLLLVVDKGHGNPVLGAYNLRTKAPLFQGEGLSWELEYENGQKDILHASPTLGDFSYKTKFSKDGNAQLFTVTWQNQNFAVKIPIKLNGPRLEASLQVDNLTKDLLLTNVTFPRFLLGKLPGHDTLVTPYFSGQRQENPTEDFQTGDIYPSTYCSLQMCCYYNDDEQGVYFAYEDPLARTKTMAIRGHHGQLQQDWKHPVAYKSLEVAAGNSFSCGDARAVLELYAGDWYEAGRIYRRFLETTPWWIAEIPRTGTPEWFRNNPLWLGSLNPNGGVMPVEGYRYVNEYFEVPVSHVSGLMTSQTGEWRFGPDWRLQDNIGAFFPRLHALNVHLVPYYNSRLFYCGKGAEEENSWSTRGEPFVIRQRDGKPIIEYSDYGVMCPAAKSWQEHLIQSAEKFAGFGLDGVYHDQLGGSRPRLCYATNHGHLPGDPAAFLSQGHWHTYAEGILGDLRKKWPNLIHTGEDASEPYLKCLDGFVTWRYGRSNHVPLFQSLYAPRVQFVGRGCFASVYPTDYESFYPKYGEQLVFGEQIGWTYINTVRFPSPMRAWLKKLALLRYDLADFFNSAEMQKMLKFQKKPETLTARWGVQGESVNTTDKILHGVWKHKDGRILAIFLNTVNEPQTVLPPDSFLASRGAAILAEGKEPLYVPAGSPAPAVILKPFEAQLWLLTNQPDQAWAARHARVMQKIATVMDDLGLMLNMAPSFQERKELDASKHEFLRIKDASWLLGACRFVKTNLGFDPKNAPDNWAVCPDKSCIYFGRVDFGEQCTRMEGEFACDRDGVTVELVDLTLDHPHKVLATFTLGAGGWYNYHTVQATLTRPICGQRDVMFRFAGGNCNFKGWRTLD
jgi:hypothetical protein